MKRMRTSCFWIGWTRASGGLIGLFATALKTEEKPEPSSRSTGDVDQ